MTPTGRRLPRLALGLGYAGLLPQIAALLLLAGGDPEVRFSALALAFAYAALILSFLGGLWWGLAAKADAPPSWLWVAAIAPSLVALASAWPWAVGLSWPGPSLAVLGAAVIGSLEVDRRLVVLGIAPPGWLHLRLPLSLGLGALTLAAAFV